MNQARGPFNCSLLCDVLSRVRACAGATAALNFPIIMMQCARIETLITACACGACVRACTRVLVGIAERRLVGPAVVLSRSDFGRAYTLCVRARAILCFSFLLHFIIIYLPNEFWRMRRRRRRRRRLGDTAGPGLEIVRAALRWWWWHSLPSSHLVFAPYVRSRACAGSQPCIHYNQVQKTGRRGDRDGDDSASASASNTYTTRLGRLQYARARFLRASHVTVDAHARALGLCGEYYARVVRSL